jgi:3-phenylpropionate/trans-cinnamate dioxygenase ferredoxin subunit
MAFEPVIGLDEVPVGGCRAVLTGGEPVAIVRPDEETVKAVHNTCSHEQYELAPEGELEANDIECALHGSMFDLDTGEPDALPATEAIPVFACRVSDGQVEVDADQQLNDAPLPRH